MGSRGSGRAPDLSERHRRLLSALVKEYVESGEPVPSQRLAAASGLGLSPASIRAILVQLEEQGYLLQPHTSAGRIPTDLGYRTYVDLLLHGRRPARAASHVVRRLRRVATVEDALVHVTQELSRAAHHVAFAFVPGNDEALLQQIDFVPLGPSKILVVVVAVGGHLFQKVIEIDDPVRADDLWRAANYLNTEFAGWPLRTVRTGVTERLHQERTLYDALLVQALHLARSTFEELAPSATLFVQGTSTLLDDVMPGEDSVPLETLGVLLRMIEEKSQLIRLLTEYFEGPGLTVVIGAEHTAPDLRRFSLVASTHAGGPGMATVGVLGPTRMRYWRAIPAVDRVAQAFHRALLQEVTG